jgi:hypothetical protein
MTRPPANRNRVTARAAVLAASTVPSSPPDCAPGFFSDCEDATCSGTALRRCRSSAGGDGGYGDDFQYQGTKKRYR